jgi:hypothetical protein
MVRLTPDNIGKDISLYVQHWASKIQQKFDIADCDVEAITQSICKKAEGATMLSKSVGL